MTKNTHKQLGAVTELVAFCFLSIVVLLGGISVITVQAQYSGTIPGSDNATTGALCSGAFAVSGTTQCNVDLCAQGCQYVAGCPVACMSNATDSSNTQNQCPTGLRECAGYGCVSDDVSCPTSDATSASNQPLPPSCSGAFVVSGTRQCNYAVCTTGCTYDSHDCPLGCLTATVNNSNQNNSESDATATNSQPTSATNPTSPSGNTATPSLQSMQGVIQRVDNDGRLTIVHSNTGDLWRVITTNETVYSSATASAHAFAPQQAIKVYYSIIFEGERLIVAKGIAVLSYSPVSTQETPANSTVPLPTQPTADTQPSAGSQPNPDAATTLVPQPMPTMPKPQPTSDSNAPGTASPGVQGPYPVPAASDGHAEQQFVSRLGDAEQKKFLEYCKRFGIVTPTACRALIADTLEPDCRDAGATTPDECDALLRERHATAYCDKHGVSDTAACRALIVADHRGELRCGDLDATACRERSQTQFTGHIAAGVTIREAVTKAIQLQKPGHIAIPALANHLQEQGIDPAIIPLKPDTQTSFLAVPSDKAIDVSSNVAATVSIPYVIIPDADADGISDDLETHYGTDPHNADTDSDDFTDADEIQSNNDPLAHGGEAQTRELQDTERALITHESLGQPAYQGTADPNFTIEPIPDTDNTKGLELRGTATPNSFILIYVYSKLPMVLTAKTDEFGNWVYDLQESLIDDRHTVYIAVTDQTGRITKKSNPLSFLVAPAVAVTRTTFLTDEQVPKTQSSTNFGVYYLAGGVLLVVIALILVISEILKRTSRDA